MKVFLYIKGTEITTATKRKLVKGGYIPIEVESFDRVKIVEPIEVLSAQLDAISKAALKTIAACGTYERPKEMFAQLLANSLMEKPKPQ